MSHEELTPESIPPSREQIDDLVSRCARLLSVRGETSPDRHLLTDDCVLEFAPPIEIEDNLQPVPHDSKELGYPHSTLFISIGHDGNGNVVQHVGGPAIEVQFLQYRRILHDFWLPSSVKYQLEEPSGDIYKSTDATSSMVFSSARLKEGLEKSEGADPTLYAALRALQDERDERMKNMLHDWQRHMDTLQSRFQSEQEERCLGFQTVSYSEADILIGYIQLFSANRQDP